MWLKLPSSQKDDTIIMQGEATNRNGGNGELAVRAKHVSGLGDCSGTDSGKKCADAENAYGCRGVASVAWRRS